MPLPFVRSAIDLLLGARCPACERSVAGPRAPEYSAAVGICAGCTASLHEPPPPPPALLRGSNAIELTAAAAYSGPGRRLLSGYKAGRYPALASLLADLIIAADTGMLTGRNGWGGEPVDLVPIPSTRVRFIGRGLDPAGEIARELAVRTGSGLAAGALVRRDRGRQRGRTRAERLSGSPKFGLGRAPSGPVLLVDDVVTTGATLVAAARVLERAGVELRGALAFAIAPPPSPSAGTRRGG